jgi:alpha-L-fucosidase 2
MNIPFSAEARLLLIGLCLTRAALAAEPSSPDLNSAPREPLSLWYRKPAGEWTQALPVGNGRLGAMVFGGVNRERIQLNEGTLWAGGPYDPVNPDAKAALPEVRRLIFAGKIVEAGSLVDSKVLAKPIKQMPYETVGDLFLDFPAAANPDGYRRDLNLDTAVATTIFTADGVTFTREAFSSAVDQIIVVHLTADKPGRISFKASMTTPQRAQLTVESGDTLVMRGPNGDASGIAGALTFESRTKVLAEGGTTTATGDTVAVAHADSATLLIAIATSFKSYRDVGGDPGAIVRRQISAALSKATSHPSEGIRAGYDEMLLEHVAAHQRLFRRVALSLGQSNAMDLPTNERIARFAEGRDPQLAALYYQFGRYLLISCSRPGGQPATLQGLWNDSMTPPWESKYTININTEMNYWPAESANLGECVEPLQAMIEDLSRTGARTAQEMYGAHGWVVHHNTDLWRASAPIDGSWGLWPTGGAWLCQTLWEHYLFSADKGYLAQIYPLLKGSAQFFLDTLVEDPNSHWLVTNPSMSPEHLHFNGQSLCAGPTMDMEILRDLFSECIIASEALETDAEFRQQLASTRARLAPLRIGGAGQLQEWQQDWDMQVPEIHHRHVSHLYGLYPSAQIGVDTTPALAAAVKKSLAIRGDEATGWGTAWRICLWARLRDGDHALSILNLLLSPGLTYPNLFDSCPPFEIDGNFGGPAGITEMLLQSQSGEIHFLPALPKSWPDGSVGGMRARGGFEVDFSWHDGILTSARVRSVAGRVAHLRYLAARRDVDLAPGGSFEWDGK